MRAFRACQYDTSRWRTSAASVGVKYPRVVTDSVASRCFASACNSAKCRATAVTVRAPAEICSGNIGLEFSGLARERHAKTAGGGGFDLPSLRPSRVDIRPG